MMMEYVAFFCVVTVYAKYCVIYSIILKTQSGEKTAEFIDNQFLVST